MARYPGDAVARAASTLPEVTATVRALRQQLTGGITETIVAHVHRGEHDRHQATCPRCNGVLRARDLVCCTVETMVGAIQLERPHFYCRACREGVYPLDDALGLVAGCKQLDMQHAAAQLVTEVPYDTAQALFRDLTGVPFGSERMHTLTNQVAENLTVVDVAPSRSEIERRIAEVAAGRFRRPVMVREHSVIFTLSVVAVDAPDHRVGHLVLSVLSSSALWWTEGRRQY